MTRSRVPPAALALLGISLALVITALVRAWFSAPHMSLGLWGAEVCLHGCRGIRWDDVGGIDFDIVVAGYLATAALLAAAVTLGIRAVALINGRRPSPSPRAGQLLVVGMVAVAWFTLRILLEGKADPDWALFVGSAALVAGHTLVRRRAGG